MPHRAKSQVKDDSRRAVEVAPSRRAERIQRKSERQRTTENMEARGFEQIDTARRPSKYRAKKERRAA